MRASPSLSQLWQPHSRLCQLCRVCEQQRSCSPGFCRKELHATEGAVEVRRARRRLGEAATDERVGLFTPDKKRGTADGAGRAANLAARRGTVYGNENVADTDPFSGDSAEALRGSRLDEKCGRCRDARTGRPVEEGGARSIGRGRRGHV